MKLKLIASNIFEKQVSRLDSKSRRIIENKIHLIKENPFRFKRINSNEFSRVFRVRLNIQGKESRLIYILLNPNIILVCLLNRQKDYRDLEKYLKEIKKIL